MKIPIGVYHMEFYKIAVAKGIKIESRYPGVYLNVNNKLPYWYARVQKAGKVIFGKRFPLTQAGEKEAANYYETRLKRSQAQ